MDMVSEGSTSRQDWLSHGSQGNRMEPTNTCATCGQSNATRRCKECNFTRYCDAKCQKEDWSVHKVLCEQMKAIGISALSTQVLIDDAKFQKHMKILECTDSVSAVLVNPHDKTLSAVKLPLVRGIHEENSTRKYHTRYPSIETTAKCLMWQGEPHFGKVYGEGLASYKSVICIDHIHNAPGFTVYGKAYVGRALLVRYVLLLLLLLLCYA